MFLLEVVPSHIIRQLPEIGNNNIALNIPIKVISWQLYQRIDVLLQTMQSSQKSSPIHELMQYHVNYELQHP